MSQQTFTPSNALAAMASGDEAGFELVYEATSGVAYSLAVRIAGSAEAAAGACEAAYADLWKEAQALAAAGPDLQTRLLSRVRRYALEGAQPPAIQSAGAISTYGSARDSSGASANETAALDSLEGLQRRALELAYFGGLSVDSIAEILREPVAGIRGALREGMLKLAVVTRVSGGDSL